MEKKLVTAFPTPLGFFALPDPVGLNEKLQRIILDREQAEPGVTRSNVGGWHSRDDLFQWPHPEIEILVKWLVENVNFMFSSVLAGGNPSAGFHLQGWANVCRFGDYHTLHNHPDCIWSGVYFVDAGSDVPGRPLSGALEFLDPRPSVDMVSAPAHPFGRSLQVKPEAGNMVLFPSWLYHQVHPYFGEGTRISISFNVPALRKNS